MFLPFPYPSRLILILTLLCGLGLPLLLAEAFHAAHLSQLFLPSGTIQGNFEPPGNPVPVDTRSAGSRGIVYKLTFPST